MARANLTRGNSITENYNPHAQIQMELLNIITKAIIEAQLRYAEYANAMARAKPVRKFEKGGLTIVGELGRELIEHKVMPINESSQKIMEGPRTRQLIILDKPIK